MAGPVATLTPLSAVLLDLRAGFGVEDIAIRRDISLNRVRTIVSNLRNDGVLAKLDWNDRGME